MLTLAHIKDKSYINTLNNIIKEIIKTNGFCTLESCISQVHSSCPELSNFCITNADKFKVTKATDKGLVGKIVEFKLFGNLPNSDSCPDMLYGDIKTTNFKSINIKDKDKDKKTFNAKERLTLTNFGDPSKQSNIDTIADKNLLQETKFYDKINNGIIIIFQHESSSDKSNTVESYYNKKILGIVFYNLDEVFTNHPEIATVFQDDFNKIKTCILAHNVSQSGQTYLHICKHGSKDSNTRAFAFTNKFLTKLVSIYLELPLQVKGCSDYIEFV